MSSTPVETANATTTFTKEPIKKKVVRDEVTMYGQIEGQDKCGNCVDLDKTMKNDVTPKAEIPVDYKHYSVYDHEIGKKVAAEKKIEEIPYIERCAVAEDQTKKCEVITGFNKDDWTKVGKQREEEFSS